MIWIIALFIIVIAVMGLALGNAKKGKGGARNPIKGIRVLTMNEQPTFLKLRETLPDYIVLAQVAFSAFMTAKGYATRNLFNRKVADFVVLDKSFNIVAIVELDDSSHKNKEDKDAERDALINEAGYKVIRYRRTPDTEQIKSDFGLIQQFTIAQVPISDEPKTQLVGDAIIVQTDEALAVEKSDELK